MVSNIPQPLAGKTALVTGASRGIGRAIATRLAADGALVAVHYGNNRSEADTTVATITKAGGKAFAVQADVRKRASIEALFVQLDCEFTSRTGNTRIDILVNNAGIAPFVGIAETDEATLDDILAVNVKGVFFVTQLALSRLADGGRIITTSSAVTRTHFPGILAYSASKGFVDVFTLHLAGELGARGITVNAIAPGVIETDMAAGFVGTADGVAMVTGMQALKRIGQPADVAGLVAALVGPDGGWTTGQVIDVSGGTKL